ncbi:MAG: PSD1 and planctomycete cytochrome C domain-containing protein, partial [Gemmataceae bacterium]|nr:PSD1 and planctomycete cytochrome C domain-containing protein [Gemmataceae bacterium]
MPTVLSRFVVPFLAASLLAIPAVGSDPPLAPSPRPATDFARDVKPILAKHCYSCHGPDKQKGGLRLDRKADALAGGDGGAALVPGKAAESALLKRITSDDEAERMPPKAERLSPAEVVTLRGWIDGGVRWPDDAAADPADWWSFKPVVRPPVPTGGTHNPIDAFIHAKLAPAGLRPNPEADRRTLIRRLKFDLLGLPPSPEEVEAFIADRSPDAYEKLVERYLASPQFGERWARHWLDVVRFAESNGFEMNWERPAAWPYRDWVIRSLNADLPYDRFVMEQLAGDSLGADEATGFLVGGPWDQVKSPDPVLTANQRADELHDMVGTTGSAFLGLTVGCARCHNHKFDPVSQTDYYRLAAVFAGVQHGERPWNAGDAAARAKQADAVRAELAKADAALEALEPLADPAAKKPRRVAVNAVRNVERFAPVKALAVRFVILASNSAEPCIDELEVFTTGPQPKNVALASAGSKLRSGGDYPGASIHKLEHLTDGKYGNGRSWIAAESGRGWCEVEFKQPAEIDRVVWGRDREGKYADRLPTLYRIDVWTADYQWRTVASAHDRVGFGEKAQPEPFALNEDDRQAWRRLTRQQADLRAKLTGLERPPTAYAGRLTTPEPTFRLHRGDPTQKREPVGPGALAAVGPRLDLPADATDPQRRLSLAKWVASPANPLTARVIANRLWQGHFGTGLADTPSDLGRNGGKPSHTELLDWLAAELVEKNWSLKHLHRLIVTSATYRQASTSNPDGLAKDAQARLLWRFPPRRLEAEAIRDAVLFVSGKLDLTMGGPGFSLFEPNANYVRVYTPKAKYGSPEFRRMVYAHKPRMQLDDTFGAFDCP